MTYLSREDKRDYDREWRRRKRAGRTDTAHKPVVVSINARKSKVTYVNELKSLTPCHCCGKYDAPCAMDYHHIDGSEKSFEIGDATRGASGKVPLSLLIEEIDKCHLLCASCHRKIHSDMMCIL